MAEVEAVITLRLPRGGDIQLPRAAAAACDAWSSLKDTDDEAPLHVELDPEPAHFRCAARCIEELYRAAQRGEAAQARRRACAGAIDAGTVPELTEIAVWLGHAELLRVLQEKMAAQLEGLGTAAAIRAHFSIAADLSPEEEAIAVTAPLLAAAAPPAHPAPPALSRSLSKRARTDDAAEACLGRCCGATLRTMLGVSRAWAQRARATAALADWLEATLVVDDEGEGGRTAEIGWALAHADDLQKLLRRLPAVARLRVGGEQVELEPLLGAQVLDGKLLRRATAGGDEEDEDEDEDEQPDETLLSLRHAAAMLTVMKSSTLTTIGYCAFRDCSSLASITPLAGLVHIGKFAFQRCASLASVTLPDGFTSIGECSFYGCASLASVALPDSLGVIGDYAFYDCSSLVSITLPDSLLSIGKGAFNGCTSLAYIALPAGLIVIGDYAFYDCSSLTSIALPAGFTSISEHIFQDCSSLASIALPPTLTSVGRSAFRGCSSLSSITLPPSLTSVGEGAFPSSVNVQRMQ